MQSHCRRFTSLHSFVAATLVLWSHIHTCQSEPIENLTQAADHVFKTGTNAVINAGFSTYLGLTKTNAPVAVKRLVATTNQTSNIHRTFNILTKDKNTFVLLVRQGNMGTFYVGDTTGKLLCAVDNDGNIKNGGLTNIPVTRVEKQFNAECEWWIRRFSTNNTTTPDKRPDSNR